jgi:hypothetical protein
MKNKAQAQERMKLSEAVVDGLLAGGGAGLVMALYLLAAEWLLGEGPAAVLGWFDPSGGGSSLTGALAHVATACIYGAAFGALRLAVPRRAPLWLSGLIYGLVLWALAVGVVLPGAASSLRELSPVHFAVAHGVYGLALGVLVGRGSK